MWIKFENKISRRHICFSMLYPIIASISGQSIAQEDSKIIIKGIDGWLFPRWGSLKELDANAIDKNTDLIKMARELFLEKSVKLEVAVIPDKIRFYQEKMPVEDRYSTEVLGRYQYILNSLQSKSIRTVNGEEVFQKIKDEGQNLFYRTDQHWTQVASDAFALACAKFISEIEPNLRGSPGSGMKLGGEIRERRFGDLAELFLSAEEKKNIGRETFVVRKEVKVNKLIDEDIAPVHITGHSMVQPYFGFPQKLSNSLDRPVSLNWKSGNVGPWVNLLDYIESSAFKKNKPQVVLWQLFEPAYSHGPNAKGMWDNSSIMEDSVWIERVKSALQA